MKRRTSSEIRKIQGSGKGRKSCRRQRPRHQKSTRRLGKDDEIKIVLKEKVKRPTELVLFVLGGDIVCFVFFEIWDEYWEWIRTIQRKEDEKHTHQ